MYHNKLMELCSTFTKLIMYFFYFNPSYFGTEWSKEHIDITVFFWVFVYTISG